MRKKVKFSLFVCISVCLFACTQKNIKRVAGITEAETQMLDSIKKHSDSSYTKKYKRPDFVTAEHFLSSKDSTATQVMYDSAKKIRQILISRNDRRIFFEQFYANGQKIADLKFDELGQYHGPAFYFYENGEIQSSGNFRHGLRSGQWKEFDEKGKLLVLQYDSNGVRKN